MRSFEAYAGSVVWAAVAMLMTAAALEPVDVARAADHAPAFAAAACAEAGACAADARA